MVSSGIFTPNVLRLWSFWTTTGQQFLANKSRSKPSGKVTSASTKHFQQQTTHITSHAPRSLFHLMTCQVGCGCKPLKSHFFAGSNISGGIPVFIYKPNKMKENTSIFVYFHGGGMVLGRRENYDSACNIIAQCVTWAQKKQTTFFNHCFVT